VLDGVRMLLCENQDRYKRMGSDRTEMMTAKRYSFLHWLMLAMAVDGTIHLNQHLSEVALKDLESVAGM